MTCGTFMELLDDLLEGRLPAAERRSVEEHLESCRDCRDLKGLVAGAGEGTAPPADLLGAVLARTSGSPCGSARARLCDQIDRLLAPADDELVRMHVAGCAECAGLAAALARLAIDLPALAELDPGARFVAGVLARTSRRPTLSAVWTERLAAAWRRLALRPRIALEGAYAGAMILVMLFGTANAPFAEVPGKAIALVRTVEKTLPAAAAETEIPRIRTAVRSRLAETGTGLGERARDLSAGLKRTSLAAWEGLKKELGTVWERFASRETKNDTKGE